MDSAARAQLHRNMVSLADGNRSAFSPVYRALWPVLRAFVARHLPPPDSEDVAQEALLKVFARASNFDPERDALTWAVGIAAFEVRTARKRTERRREEFGERVRQKPMDSPEQSLVDRDLEAAALEILGTLRPLDIETLQTVLKSGSPSVARATFRKRVERSLKRLKLAWRMRHGAD